MLARQGVAEAAVDLGLSPSATSRALQRLRDALDDPLLVRSGNALVPTERARELVGPTSDAVEAARAVFRPVAPFDPSVAQGEFVVAMGPELQEALFPQVVQRVAAVAPRVDLRVRDLSFRLMELARQDLLHLSVAPDLSGILPPGRLPELADVVRTPLYTRRFVVVGAREAWPDPPDLSAYAAATHVIMASDGAPRGFMDDLLALRGVQRRVGCTMTTFGAVLQVVRATSMLALVPDEILPALAPDLARHAPPVPVPEMSMELLWHHRHTTQPRHRTLRRCIGDAIREAVGSVSPPGGTPTPRSPPPPG